MTRTATSTMIPVTPRTTQHLSDWCKAYQTIGTVPRPKEVRFAIGVYQISQGMSWKISSPVRWQSFCSAAMHFIACAHCYGFDIAHGLPETLAEIQGDFPGWEGMMLRLGKAQQQVVYSLHDNVSSTRASRFVAATAGLKLHDLVVACFSLAPPEYREQGCYDEMKILCNDLPTFAVVR